MDVDPNYDPSDFLLAGLPRRNNDQNMEMKNSEENEMGVSESNIQQVSAAVLSLYFHTNVNLQTFFFLGGELARG